MWEGHRTQKKFFWLKFVICCVVHRKAASHQRLYQKQNDEYFLCVEFCFHYLSRKHYINIDPRRNTKERKKKKELGTPERNHKAKYQKDEIPRERARVRFVWFPCTHIFLAMHHSIPFIKIHMQTTWIDANNSSKSSCIKISMNSLDLISVDFIEIIERAGETHSQYNDGKYPGTKLI